MFIFLLVPSLHASRSKCRVGWIAIVVPHVDTLFEQHSTPPYELQYTEGRQKTNRLSQSDVHDWLDIWQQLVVTVCPVELVFV
jgi:hypothetical protein